MHNISVSFSKPPLKIQLFGFVFHSDVFCENNAFSILSNECVVPQKNFWRIYKENLQY